MAAEAQGCSAATGYKWIRRYLDEGPGGLRDRSSRPHRCPARISPRREAAILARRQATLEGPHRIAWALGEAHATVHRVLRRLGAPRLRDLDRPTRVVVRYERQRPGELVHVDVKKLGRIPAGGGWRVLGRAAAPNRHRGDGYGFVHAAVDGRSRMAYAEILADERKDTAAAFMARAACFFADRGVTVERVLTDNGSCYRPASSPGPWPPPASSTVGHGPIAPRPTGRSSVSTYAQVGVGLREGLPDNASRAEELERWLHHYNYHRPHMAHSGRAPITVVDNVPRKHS